MKRLPRDVAESPSPLKKKHTCVLTSSGYPLVPRDMWKLIIKYCCSYERGPQDIEEQQTVSDLLPRWFACAHRHSSYEPRKFNIHLRLLALLSLRRVHSSLLGLIPMEFALVKSGVSMSTCKLPRSAYWDALFDRWLDMRLTHPELIFATYLFDLLRLVVKRRTAQMTSQIRRLLTSHVFVPLYYDESPVTEVILWALEKDDVPLYLAAMDAYDTYPISNGIEQGMVMASRLRRQSHVHVRRESKVRMLERALESDWRFGLDGRNQDMVLGGGPPSTVILSASQNHWRKMPPNMLLYTMRVWGFYNTGRDTGPCILPP